MYRTEVQLRGQKNRWESQDLTCLTAPRFTAPSVTLQGLCLTGIGLVNINFPQFMNNNEVSFWLTQRNKNWGIIELNYTKGKDTVFFIKINLTEKYCLHYLPQYRPSTKSLVKKTECCKAGLSSCFSFGVCLERCFWWLTCRRENNVFHLPRHKLSFPEQVTELSKDAEIDDLGKSFMYHHSGILWGQDVTCDGHGWQKRSICKEWRI